MICSTCNQLYNAATESNVCPHPVVTSPATEDRATAIPVLGWQVFDTPKGRRLKFADGTSDYGSPRLMQVVDAFLAHSAASQKRIEALEAALSDAEDEFLAATVNVSGNLLIVRTTELDAAMRVIVAARAALKEDS